LASSATATTHVILLGCFTLVGTEKNNFQCTI